MPIIPMLAALALSGQAMPQTAAIAPPVPLTSVEEAGRRAAVVAVTAGMSGEIVVTDADDRMADVVFGFAEREHARVHRVGQRWIWGS